MPHLTFIHSIREPIPLGERTVIGRSPDHADVVIDDKRLSRRHCEIHRDGDLYIVSDLESRNGLKVNDQDVTRHVLKDGDELSLGGLKMTFTTGEVTSEDPAYAATLPAKGRSAQTGGPVLKLIKGTIHQVLIPVTPLPFSIGRRPNNRLVLADDRQASGNHARIDYVDGGYKIVHLQSTNGIKLNGIPVDTEADLYDGARLQIGSQTFRFDLHGGLSSREEVPGDSRISASPGGTSLASGPEHTPQTAPTEQRETREQHNEREQRELKSEAERLGAQELEPSRSPTRMLLGMGEVALLLASILAVAGFLWYTGALRIAEDTSTDARAAAPFAAATSSPADTRNEAGPWWSFEALPDAPGQVSGWRTLQLSPMDTMAGEADVGQSGKQVMRVQRSAAARERSLWQCEHPVPVEPGATYRGAVWTRMPEGTSSGFLSMDWFSHADDRVPLRRDLRGYHSGHLEWREASATFIAPPQARFARLGVGVTGRAGIVRFDQASVGRVASATLDNPLQEKAYAPVTSGNIQVRAAGNGALSCAALDREGEHPLFSEITLRVSDGDAMGSGLSHLDWSIADPRWVWSEDDGSAALEYLIFDPDCEAARTLRMRVRTNRLELELSPHPATPLLWVALEAQVSQWAMPSGLAVVAGGRLVAFGNEVKVETATELRGVDTAGVVGYSTRGHVACANQKLRVSAPATVDLDFRLGDVRLGRMRMESLIAQSQAPDHGEANQRFGAAAVITAVDAGLALLDAYPFDHTAASAAALATVNAAARCRSAHAELEAFFADQSLADHALITRHPDLCLELLDAAATLQRELVTRAPEWRNAFERSRRFGDSLAAPAWLRDATAEVGGALLQIESESRSLATAVTASAAAACVLRTQVQQRKSTPLLKAALIATSTSQTETGRLLLLELMRRYPLSHNATLARAQLLEGAERALREREGHVREGLVRVGEAERQRLHAELDELRASSQTLIHDSLAVIPEIKDWPQTLAQWRESERALGEHAERLARALEAP